MRIFLMSLVMLCSLSAVAVTDAPEAAKWDALVERMIKEGSPMEADDLLFKSLTRRTPDDPSKPRQADYISAVGAQGQEVFRPFKASAVSETWTLNADDDWFVDQWLYESSIQGELRWIYHSHLVIEKNGLVKSSERLPTDTVESESSQQRWNDFVATWF